VTRQNPPVQNILQLSFTVSHCYSQCCGSGILSRIPDPDCYPTWIPIQKQQQKRGVKKICCHTFFCRHKFHIIENYFIFEMLKKKISANFQKIIELFTQKIVTKLSKIWVWDPGSGKKPIPDPGSRGQKAPDPGYGSATLVTGYLIIC
jgi:hypothetical protein